MAIHIKHCLDGGNVIAATQRKTRAAILIKHCFDGGNVIAATQRKTRAAIHIKHCFDGGNVIAATHIQLHYYHLHKVVSPPAISRQKEVTTTPPADYLLKTTSAVMFFKFSLTTTMPAHNSRFAPATFE